MLKFGKEKYEMKTKFQSLMAFITAILVLCILASVAVLGYGDYSGVFADDGVTLGLDLIGGTRLVYAPDVAEGVALSDEQMNTVSSMLRARLDFYGYTEATVTVDDNNRFVVEIPKVNGTEAEKLLSATAKLTFEVKDGETYTVVMDGSAIERATASFGNAGHGFDEWFVSLKIKDEHRETFRAATEKALKLSDKSIYIKLDGETYSAPKVSEVLDTDSVMIAGSFDRESATALAGVITSGQLPFALKVEQSSQVDATLGANALRSSLIAGGIGLLLVILFMVAFYRLPGIVSALSLLGYVASVGLVLSILHINLSLAGIAGIILSIGMAVDANVIIFERIKEELSDGKSTRAALKAGFHKALTAILDSNVTTIIAVVVLYFFGTGSIQGFAITLGIGVVFSMIFSIFVTRFLLNCLVGMQIHNLRLWGARRKTAKADSGARSHLSRFHFIAARKYFLIALAAVLVFGGVSIALRGFNPDVDFTGGTTMQIDFSAALKGGSEISDEMLNEIVATVKGATDSKGAPIGVLVSSAQRADGADVILKLSELDMDERDAVYNVLRDRFGLGAHALVSASNVGATVSAELRRDAILATVVAIILMLIYISIRFDLASGIAAVICLAHDVLITLFAYSIFGIPLNINMIAALLTILGYSINATIVIFDRVRENRRKMLGTAFGEVVNVSVRQTFLRSLNTTLTTFITCFMVYLLGVTSIKDFTLPLIVGILAGFFSSVCLAGNIWSVLADRLHFGKKQNVAKEQE